ncbi:polyprenol monophosphomannose synthase [Salinibacter ruber]|uniref:polyprenol monophosphomannose synthase n=1 Tax=Salinibacter ruber TaxID=146919 RepID=UPI002342BE31
MPRCIIYVGFPCWHTVRQRPLRVRGRFRTFVRSHAFPSPPVSDPSPSSSDASPPDALVIIPTYNEADNIGPVIDQVLEQSPPLSVLVVDDNSTDGTADLVRSKKTDAPDRVHLIERSGKLGLGTAYLRGFRYALAQDYTYICEMDADRSHDPNDLPRLIAPVREGEVALAIGSRYVEGVRVINWPLSRLVLSYGAGVYTRAITRLPLLDVTAGFKCFHRRVLETLPLDRVNSDGYAFQVEMHYRTWRAGFPFTEVPVVFTERTEGESKMRREIVVEAALKVWELRLQDLLGRL